MRKCRIGTAKFFTLLLLLYRTSVKFSGFKHISESDLCLITDDTYSDLISLLNKHPLFSYYLKPEIISKKREDLLLILKQCLRFEYSNGNKRFYIQPVIEDLILQKRNNITELIKNETFSSSAYYDVMGNIAIISSNNEPSNKISLKRFLSVIKNNKEFRDIFAGLSDTDLLRTLIKERYFSDFIECKENYLRFRDKISRLFFAAYSISQKKNQYLLFDDLLNCCELGHETSSEARLVRVDNKYDSIILLSTMTLHFLPVVDANRFLLFLAETQAHQFNVNIRYKQIAAIAIITYAGLVEANLIDNKTRKQLFTASYGQTIYSFQQNQIENVLNSKFYKTVLDNHIKSLHTGFNKEEKINDLISTQPVFFFLYGQSDLRNLSYNGDRASSFENIEIISTLFELREKTWKNEYKDVNEREYDIQMLLQYIKTSKSILKKINCDKFTFSEQISLYAIQALLYAIFNISEYIHLDDAQTRNDLAITMILADYYTRKTNFIYDLHYKEIYYNRFLYLLCGPFRVSCTSLLTEKNQSIVSLNCDKVILNDTQKADYDRWLNNETGRYKILLLRLLAFTNFYEKRSYSGRDLPDTSNADFLDYDRIDIYSIYADKQRQTDDIKPLNWYK